MRKRYYFFGLFCAIFFFLYSCSWGTKSVAQPYHKPLEIVKLSEHNYLHISYIKTKNASFIPCNGYIYINGSEAIVFDTPLNDSISSQLIHFIEQDIGATVKGIVLNHHHSDAAGGVKAFAKANIPVYAHELTAQLLVKDSISIDHTFSEIQQIKLGDKVVENFYPGEAHTRDNIVSYIPSEKLLYGGCMVKAIDASKGNLEDANEATWSQTIENIKNHVPDVEVVIPGHGQLGGKGLLDYTAQLFLNTKN